MYRLVAVDLDGTLLDSNKKLSEKNKKAVRLAQEKGVKVVVCSGRVFAGARMVAAEAGITGPLIACNGAVIKDMGTGELLYSNPMKTEDFLKVVDICHNRNIYFHTYIGDTMYTEQLEYSSKLYGEINNRIAKNFGIYIQAVINARDIIEQKNDQISKIVVISKDLNLLHETRKEVEKINTVSVMSSGKDNFEVVNSGVSKGFALRFLCGKLGITGEETIAIGDNENDYSMLKFAGLGIAMGNAERAIKDICGYITLSNDESGVYEAIQKFIL